MSAILFSYSYYIMVNFNVNNIIINENIHNELENPIIILPPSVHNSDNTNNNSNDDNNNYDNNNGIIYHPPLAEAKIVVTDILRNKV